MYGDINLDFYSFPGLGELQRPLELDLKGPFVFQDLLYRLPDTGIFFGARQQYRHVETGLADSPDLAFLPPVVGDYVDDLFDQSITTSGLGLVGEYDSRDNPFNPQRGVAASRYQGEDVAVVEGQLDYKLTDRWKVGIFTGLGRAADSFGDLDDADNVDSYGAGFRYLIPRRYGFVMGLDVARGPDETAVYVQAGSTW